MVEYGVAADLGTTEVRVSLWDLGKSQRITAKTAPNPQARVGADVLSRLFAASQSESGARELGRLAQDAIGTALKEMCGNQLISCSAIHAVEIVGNTAMLALLTGRGYGDLLKPAAWRRAFEFSFSDPHLVRKTWGVADDCRLDIVQPMGGFVGSDLIAGMLATDLAQGPAGSLLIDFGANTEMALWDGSRLWATSAAGGPAFEGYGISCGMPALPGAIWRVACSPTLPFEYSVIGQCEPQGICASGLVDAGACLLRSGILSPGGRFKGQTSTIALDEQRGIIVTSQDIDALQRAKAGVAAAIQMLMNKASVTTEEIQRVCVSGAFGSYLDVANAMSIGLLPLIDEARVKLCGNTALRGCEMLLNESGDTGAVRQAVQEAVVISLSGSAGFEDAFVENLFLRPWSGETARSHHARPGD